MITGSALNTDVAQPPNRRTSPGEDVLQAVCHIRVIGELTKENTKCLFTHCFLFWTSQSFFIILIKNPFNLVARLMTF